MTTQRDQPGLKALLHGDAVRRFQHDGRTLYAVVDVVAALAETGKPTEFWNDLKTREPSLADVAESTGDGAVEAVDLDGVLRLVQSIASPRAERIKRWLAQSARQRLEEADNPELALLRARKLYEHKGYPPRWVDKRLRGVSARHELTAEWFKRGVADGMQYRELTNEMMRSAFGMDVESYRSFKHLTGTRGNLRDHMNDLELVLTTLAETVAVNLHRERGSKGFEQLALDAKDAGEIAATTLREVEQRSGKAVTTRGNHGAWWVSRGARRGTASKAVA